MTLDDPTWEDLIAVEPRLEQLLAEARQADSGGDRFCGVSAWYGYTSPGFKVRMNRLAGFTARDPRLRTMRAHQVATEKIYATLPACRGCACQEEELCCA